MLDFEHRLHTYGGRKAPDDVHECRLHAFGPNFSALLFSRLRRLENTLTECMKLACGGIPIVSAPSQRRKQIDDDETWPPPKRLTLNLHIRLDGDSGKEDTRNST
jgi:hypothetical protein